MTVDGVEQLIALRAVLGLGAALVMPATLSTITGTFAAAQRVKAVSLWAGVAGGSAVLGLLSSGVLLGFWSWRSIFALNVVLALVAIVGTLRVVPESADPEAPKLDLVGAALAVVGLVSLVYSIIEAPTYGWTARPHPGRTGRGRRGPGRVRVRRAASYSPHARPAHLHQPRTVGREPDDLRAVLRVLRLRLRGPAVPPARPRLLGTRTRPC